MKATGPVLLGFLALASYSFKGNPASATHPPPAGGAVAQEARPGSKPCDPTNDSSLQCAAHSFFGDSIKEYSQFYLSPEQAVNVRFVIATVPDPVHTDLALAFDRFVEAIGQGAQEAGYTFDHAVLPWLPPQKGSAESKKDSPADSQSLPRENSPGVLIFRNAEALRGSSKHLFVLLVGETPTAGINKEQFKRALDLIHHSQGGKGPVAGTDSPHVIDIIGPTFSGSLYSLRFLLDEENRLAPHSLFRIRSGVAMSSRAIAWFKKASIGTDDANLLLFKDTDAYQIARFVEYVKHQGYREDEIALLSEDETDLGRLTPDKKLTPDEDPIIRVYFPREISQLRAAYQGDPVLSAGANDSNIPHERLTLDLNSTGSNEDSVPTYSGKQAALSQEAVLMGIITVLKVHPHRFILLRATDPKDLIFLTRFLRSNFPEDRIITMSADQLLPRDINDTTFRGVLSLTNYPLLPRQLSEFDPPRAHRVFASTECAGLFNATLSLLKEKENEITGSDTLPEAGYTEYTPPTLPDKDPSAAYPGPERRPMVWLTVMGDDGYWPLTALAPASPGDTSSVLRPCSACSLPQPIRLAPSSFNLLILIGVGAVSAAFLYLTWKADFKQRSNLHQQTAMMTDGTRGSLIGVASLALILAWVILGSPFSPGNYWPPLVVIAGAATVAIFTTFNLRARGQGRAALFFAVWSAVLASPLLWIIKFHHSTKESILLYRMAWVQSGVSPTFPLLLICAAVFAWVWFMLKLRSLFDLRRPWLPRGIPLLPGDDEHNTHEYSEVISLNSRFLWLALVFSFVILTRFRPLSLDGVRFDQLYLAFFLACVLLIANSMFSAWQSWNKCRGLLLHLNRTPLRWAFRRIHGFSWKPLWGLYGGDLMSAYKALSRSLEAFAHLEASLQEDKYKDQTAYLQNRTKLVRADLGHLRSAFAGPAFMSSARQLRVSHDDVIHRMGALQKNLALMCSLIWLAVLQKVWESDTRLVAGGKESLAKPDSKADHEIDSTKPESKVTGRQDQPVLLAEEFLSLIYINFIHRVLIRIRWLMIAAASAFVLLLFSAKVYPFEPKAAIDFFFILLFVGIAGVAAMIYSQMHRDSILSHLTKTTPGELGTDFWIRMVGFGAIPLLSLVATQVPGLNRFLFQWLKPMFDALHR